MGQKWKPDWHPTSVLHKDYTLNIYGGRNGEGKKLGLYPKKGKGGTNEEWRRQDTGDYIGQPECIQIKYGRAEFVKGPGEVQQVFNVPCSNEMDEAQDIKIEYEKKKVKETTTSHTIDVNFEQKFSLKLKASGGAKIPFVAEATSEVEAGMEFTFKEG